MSEHKTDVTYHRPRPFGTCDGCGKHTARATHEMPNGDDLCGYCYAVEKGYVRTQETGTEQ